jgi:hypothetical protein
VRLWRKALPVTTMRARNWRPSGELNDRIFFYHEVDEHGPDGGYHNSCTKKRFEASFGYVNGWFTRGPRTGAGPRLCLRTFELRKKYGPAPEVWILRFENRGLLKRPTFTAMTSRENHVI